MDASPGQFADHLPDRAQLMTRDNALAETTIGLFKTEAVGRGSPFLNGPLRTIDDVEYTTMEWVDWFNNRRLHSQLDYVPPEEYEAAYYAHSQTSQPATPQQ
jgi:putative transposase